MYYHASKIKDLKVLKPHVSMHGKHWVYFSDKMENVLVYLSNAVEKFIFKKYKRPLNEYKKWATYGFTQDGIIRLEEYYPNALEDTFKGIKAYIYTVNDLSDVNTINDIKNVFVVTEEIKVDGCIEIEDAYDEILKLEKQGKIAIQRYEETSEKKRNWIKQTIINEYQNSENMDYKEFLIAKFDWLSEDVSNA